MGGFGPFELVLIIVLAIGGPVLYLVSVLWVYRDAENRGMNGLLVVILVALILWPLSLVAWVLLRPNDMA